MIKPTKIEIVCAKDSGVLVSVYNHNKNNFMENVEILLEERAFNQVKDFLSYIEMSLDKMLDVVKA